MAGGASSPQAITVRISRRRMAMARIKAFARDFRLDVRGIAAVELGFISPNQIVMLLGTNEVTRAN